MSDDAHESNKFEAQKVERSPHFLQDYSASFSPEKSAACSYKVSLEIWNVYNWLDI